MKFVIPIVALSCAVPASGAFVLVENFDNLNTAALNGQNGWTAGATWTVAANPTGGPGKAARGAAIAVPVPATPPPAQGASKALSTPIANNTTGTSFFRVYRSGNVNISAGLTDNAGGALFGSYETQLNSQQSDSFKVNDGGTFDDLGAGTFANMSWYNIWMVANNTNDTYRLYTSTGSGAATAVLDPAPGTAGDFDFNFRNNTGTLQTTPLNSVLLAIGVNTGATGTFFVDDIYVDNTGLNLTNPVPEPSVAGLAILASAVFLRRKRN